MNAKFYRCDSYARWFVVKAPNLTVARREARRDFGPHVKEVRLATDEDVAEYRAQYGGEPGEAF